MQVVDVPKKPFSLESACVAHYKMNDNAASTVVIDSRGFSNGTAQQNTEDIDTAGKVGGALSFDGSSDYVDTNNAFNSTFQNSFSINLWCKADDGIMAASQYLFSIDIVSPVTHVSFRIRPTGKVSCSFAAKGDTISAEEDTASFVNGANDWKMLTMVATKISAFDGKVVLYVDGSLRKEGSIEVIEFSNYTTGITSPFIGVYNREGLAQVQWFDGDIDNVMIFNKALTQREISFLYNAYEGTEALHY